MIMQIDWDVEADGCDSGTGVSSASPTAGAMHVMAASAKRSARIVAQAKRQSCEMIGVIPARGSSCTAMNFLIFLLQRGFGAQHYRRETLVSAPGSSAGDPKTIRTNRRRKDFPLA
jgi:hypothetical protein